MAQVNLKNQAVLKIALCVLLAGGVLGVFFFSHLVPFSFPNQRDRELALKADYEKKATELARARASVADLPRFEAEYEQLHERWAMAAELLPADRQLAALLRKITLAGQQTGVQFLMFKPSPANSETYYTELPMEISIYGGYHQVGSFLAELANMRRIVTVSNVKLSTNTKGDALATTSAALTASAYSLNPNAASPPAAPAATPAPAEEGTKEDAKGTAKKGAASAREES
ncbi:MAG TPA: type 4a pilus biogenesis protein PilO [Candidatus Limnocylindria bacterium]|nr:type 4a pilus biogenesis protein PilO [Candidatus Limnocylindria bacterium]